MRTPDYPALMLSDAELATWAAMAGVLLTLTVVAAVDAINQRSRGAIRALVFMLVLGSATVLMTGLPEHLWPHWPILRDEVLKIGLAPLGCGIALFYLGLWTGSAKDDQMSRYAVPTYSMVLIGAAPALAWLAATGHPADELLLFNAALAFLAVIFAALVAVRSVTLGDELARGMVVACLFLAVSVSGLYATGLGVVHDSWQQGMTAAATVGYFLTVVTLSIQRTRAARRLKREAMGSTASEEGSGHLPRGVALMQRVDDALWRSARVDRPCIVAAVAVPNLYAYADTSPLELEPQIIATLAARIRRIVGFRNVLGLYHSRCFLLAVSAVQDPRRGSLVADRMLRYVERAVPLDPRTRYQEFVPQIGIGVVHVEPHPNGEQADALSVMNRAEQLALLATSLPERIVRTRHIDPEGSIFGELG
ncbi:hypothetical protein [Hydrogenophaga sp. 5NK40-0174]|uniref:hypothetical protein n=1 Tax=Hydrogenophaga sp. 5NK40-0174 TaxID=3127649 RepID=UPI0031056C50